MSTEQTATSIREAVDKIASSIADRAAKDNDDHNREGDMKEDDLAECYRYTHDLVRRHVRAGLIDWLLGDLR